MEFAWISVAILSAAGIGLVNIFDSHLISKRMPSYKSYLLVVSPFIFTSGIVLALLFPLPTGLSSWQSMVVVAAGLLRAASVIILLYTLRREEVSRAVPVVSIYPVFVAIIAVPLLNEAISFLQGMAIAIVVIGVFMISVKKNTGKIRSWLGVAFFLLLTSSLLLAMADIASKYALDYISFWNMYWVSILSLAVICLLVSLRFSTIKGLANIKNPRSAIMLVTVNETLVVFSSLMLFWAMKGGPVSMVSTIASTRPVFVIIYALILSRFLKGFLLESEMNRRVLVVRLIAIAMIVSGMAIIYLS